MKKTLLIFISFVVAVSVFFSLAINASAERNWIISPTATVYPATTNNGGLNTSAPDSTNTGDNTNTDNSHQKNTEYNSAYNTDSTRSRDRNNDNTSHSRAEIIDTSPFSPDTGNSSNSMYAVIIALFSLTVVSAMILKKGKAFKNEKNFN